jgi:hypothetical protein
MEQTDTHLTEIYYTVLYLQLLRVSTPMHILRELALVPAKLHKCVHAVWVVFFKKSFTFNLTILKKRM